MDTDKFWSEDILKKFPELKTGFSEIFHNRSNNNAQKVGATDENGWRTIHYSRHVEQERIKGERTNKTITRNEFKETKAKSTNEDCSSPSAESRKTDPAKFKQDRKSADSYPNKMASEGGKLTSEAGEGKFAENSRKENSLKNSVIRADWMGASSEKKSEENSTSTNSHKDSSEIDKNWMKCKEYLLKESAMKCQKKEKQMAEKLLEIRSMVRNLEGLSQKVPIQKSQSVKGSLNENNQDSDHATRQIIHERFVQNEKQTSPQTTTDVHNKTNSCSPSSKNTKIQPLAYSTCEFTDLKSGTKHFRTRMDIEVKRESSFPTSL